MSINSLMNQTIVLKSNLGAKGRHGETDYVPQQTLRGRFEQTNTTIRTAENERTPIDGRVFLPANAAISRGDKITYNNLDFKVMTVNPITLGNGRTHHFEVMVQNWSYAS